MPERNLILTTNEVVSRFTASHNLFLVNLMILDHWAGTYVFFRSGVSAHKPTSFFTSSPSLVETNGEDLTANEYCSFAQSPGR